MTMRRPEATNSYFKVQYYHPTTLSWMDVHRRFETIEAAKESAQPLVPAGTEWRVVEIRGPRSLARGKKQRLVNTSESGTIPPTRS